MSTSCRSKSFGLNSNSFNAVGSSFENEAYPRNFSGTAILLETWFEVQIQRLLQSLLVTVLWRTNRVTSSPAPSNLTPMITQDGQRKPLIQSPYQGDER